MNRSLNDWHLQPRYTVKRVIGSGAYGQVAACFDNKTQQYVAIKRFTNVFSDVIDCKRTLREISILNQMRGTLVVNLIDIVITQPDDTFDTIYLVLEIADSDIKKLLREPFQLDALHTKSIMYNLLSAMRFIHESGVIHRDLKPANVLINKDCSLKICDFGLSRTIKKNQEYIPPQCDENVNIRKIGAEKCDHSDGENYTRHVVTRWYRAPEIILVQPEYGTAIDMWSIGCIFAELLQTEDRSVPRQPLFPGSYCYPLSPRRKPDDSERTFLANDQLRIIFSVIGTPSDEDLEELDKEDARVYIKSFRRYPPIDFYKRFSWVETGTVDLLIQMLQFNPRKRITVMEALKHPYFNELAPSNFPRYSKKVSIIVDRDYKDEDLTVPLLRRLILDQAKTYRKGSPDTGPTGQVRKTSRVIFDTIKRMATRKR